MGSGPTQGATELKDELQRWETRPRAARMVRWTIMFGPSITALLVTLWMSFTVPPERLGLSSLWYLVLLITVGVFVVALLERVARRFLPLEALFRLSLVFPDSPPSRFQVLLRGGNPKNVVKMLEEVDAGEREAPDDQQYLETMLSLVSTLQSHDRLTRGHSERVRGYSETIGVELGLSEPELDKLRWAALLHDVGKLNVPSEILNKPGRPDEDEWKILSSHPAEGALLAAPLRGWLGEWFSAIGQHHERFDGNGYPHGIAGTDQHISARIVCVADAYDVMTSTRSYKKPLSHSAARAELAKNSGTQFDPTVVRVMLKTAVPAARWNFGWLVALLNRPGLSVGASSVGTATAVAAGAVTGVLGISPVVVDDAPNDAIAFAQDTLEEVAPETANAAAQDARVSTAGTAAVTTTASSTSSSTSTTTTVTTRVPTTPTSIIVTTLPPTTRPRVITTSPPTVTPTTVTPTTVAPSTTTSATTAAPTSTTTTSTTTTSTTTTSTTTTSTTVPAGFPIADFTFDESLGFVQFFDDTTGDNPRTYLWDFDNGLTSTMRNPTTFYTVIGDYEVTVTVTNEVGSASVTKTISVPEVTELAA